MPRTKKTDTKLLSPPLSDSSDKRWKLWIVILENDTVRMVQYEAELTWFRVRERVRTWANSTLGLSVKDVIDPVKASPSNADLNGETGGITYGPIPSKLKSLLGE